MEAHGAAAKLRIFKDEEKFQRLRYRKERRKSRPDRRRTLEKKIERLRDPGGLSFNIRLANMRLGERDRPFEHCVFMSVLLASINKKDDPWDLPRMAFLKKPTSSSLRTHSGYWKEKEDEFIAIRSEGGGEGSSSASSSPSYQGVRRTLEFYTHNGTKTDWVMHEYNMLNKEKSPIIVFMQEDVVFRKVFKRDQTYWVPSCCRDFDTALEHYHAIFPKDVEQKSLHGGCESMTEPFPRGGCEEAGSGSGEFPTASSPDGESDDVWQHFTRINTKDPDVVYAACHRCDRVLKAPSMNGTSHLRRHRKTKTCTCHNNPSSTDEDQEIIRELRTNLDLYKQGKMEGRVDSPMLDARLASVDPWDLPTPRYFTSSLSRKTHQGRWEEIKSSDKLIAIRIGQLPVQQYAGLKRTLKFHHDNGTKMDWIMLEYYQVDEYNTRDLLLEGGMVFRKVIQIFKDAVKELERMWNGDDEEEECYIGEREEEVKECMSTLLRDCLLGEVAQGDQSLVGKRKRSGAPDGGSKVWLYFTKIYTTDPDRVYAVCHCCDRCYKGHSKNGTSHLKRHNKACSSKHRKV